MRLWRHVGGAAAFSLLLAACGSAQVKGEEQLALESMDHREAEKVVAKFRRQEGIAAAAPSRAPQSLAELVQILKNDEIHRFAAAERYAQTRGGFEVMALRASLQLLWAEGQLSAAQVMDVLQRHDQEEAALLEAKPTRDKTEDKILAALRRRVRARQKVRKALQTLADSHLAAGRRIATALIRRKPNHAAGYRAAANYHRLQRDWQAFDAMMQQASQLSGAEDVGMRYLRAMEAHERWSKTGEARVLLRAILQADEGWVRAHAQLVLLQDDVVAMHGALQVLQRHSPHHPLIALTQRHVEAAYQDAVALRRALPQTEAAKASSAASGQADSTTVAGSATDVSARQPAAGADTAGAPQTEAATQGGASTP